MNLLGHRLADNLATDIHSEFECGWDRIEIHAQSVHDTTDGSIRLVESLIRWRRSPGELWATGLVLPIAEDLGLAGVCTAWASELALAAWASSTHRARDTRLEINLHPAQIDNPDFMGRFTAVMHHLSVDPMELLLSIPGRLGDDKCRTAARIMEPLTSAGATLGLDDYTGRASATEPNPDWLPPGSLVKLDTALTSGMDAHLASEVITNAVSSLHIDGYTVGAKSIDTIARLTTAIETGIDFVQGSLFSLPEPLT